MSSLTTITLSANGVSASLSARDDLRKPRVLHLTRTDATQSSASATASADFHGGNQWVITWQDSQQDRRGLALLCADGGKLDSEPEWCQGSPDGFYMVTGQCSLADSKGVLRLSLELSLPTSVASTSSATPSQPYARFDFTLVSTLNPQQFWRSPEVPSSLASGAGNGSLEGAGKVEAKQFSKEEKPERGHLIVKLKIPPKWSQPLPPLALVESDDEDDEMERGILSPISEVTEPPTSPPLRPPSAYPPASPGLHRTNDGNTTLRRPRSEVDPTAAVLLDSNVAEPPSKRPRTRFPSVSSAPTSQSQHGTLQAATTPQLLPRQPHQSPSLLGVPNPVPKPARRPLSPHDVYGGGPSIELQAVMGRNVELRTRLKTAGELNGHYMETATLLLNRLPPREVAEHLKEQLKNPRLASEQRVDIALAKQRAVTATRTLAAVEIDAEVRSLLQIWTSLS